LQIYYCCNSPLPPSSANSLLLEHDSYKKLRGKKKKTPKAQTIETSLHSDAKMKGAAAENPKKSL
jgi:hypothetical protein